MTSRPAQLHRCASASKSRPRPSLSVTASTCITHLLLFPSFSTCLAPTSRRIDAFGNGGQLSGNDIEGKTMREVLNSMHPYRLCDAHAWPLYRQFCSYQNEPIKYVLYARDGREDIPFEHDRAGFWEPCPNSTEECNDMGLTQLGLQSCLERCTDISSLGETCSADRPCALGLFCTFDEGSGQNARGICEICPSDPHQCLELRSDVDGDENNSNDLGAESCLECDLFCRYMKWGELTVEIPTNEGAEHQQRRVIPAHGYGSSPQYLKPGSAYGPLVDCSGIVLDGVDTCPNVPSLSAPFICLVDDYVKDTDPASLTRKCEASGGSALVFYSDLSSVGYSNEMPVDGFLSVKVNIPVINIAFNDGKILRESISRIGEVRNNRTGPYKDLYANITVTDAEGSDCWIDQPCSDTIPCIGKYSDGFCEYVENTESGLWCWNCPEDPFDCFFPEFFRVLVQKQVESCASNCAASIEFGTNCKLCGDAFSADSFEFELGLSEEEKCYFCPNQDMKYPDRKVPLFSRPREKYESEKPESERGVKCWQVQSLFDHIDVHKDSKNCRLVQMQNYICGCEGMGYAGAYTESRREALVWAPRVMAILSFLGSSFVVYDSLQQIEHRRKVFYQLMVQLSIFDMIGSVAYAFTSLPIPSEYYFTGSTGNDTTCTAQGFFIQVGTISCYTNVSLAVYYFLVIKKGWSEHHVHRVRQWLFASPILVGMAFAFAGIPFYDNMILWCNNAASWWPDIPVAIAILIATVVMGSVCLDVYKKEKASKKWRGQDSHNRLSRMVFWQSFWYLMAFYITWPPYLALQYSWAAGTDLSNYTLTLCAGIVVPLQGFWNCIVYMRPRYIKPASKKIFSISIMSMSSFSFFGHSRTTTVGNIANQQEGSQPTTQRKDSTNGAYHDQYDTTSGQLSVIRS